MFEIKLLNIATNQVFTKIYDSYYSYQKALHKMEHSKKLEVISYGRSY